MANVVARAARSLAVLARPLIWIVSHLRAWLLREPLLLFPLRLEIKWDDAEVKLRVYPDASQLVLRRRGANAAAPPDGFGALQAFVASGFEMLALPRRLALYTLGAYGGLQKLTEVPLARDGLRFHQELQPDKPDEERDPSSRWTHDYAEARRVGMGITITDRVQRAQLAEAEWLLVFGYDRALPAAEVLGALIEQRQLECIDAHAPTNNTAAHRLQPPARRTATPPATVAPGTAGDALARYLRLSPDAIRQIPNHESVLDTELPRHARELLFPGTYTDLNPRGPLPLLRIGDNPYGIAPTTPVRWRYGRLPYALALARTHGRTLHEDREPATPADEGLMRFDDTKLQPLHTEANAYERLQATLQQAGRATSLRLVDRARGAAATVHDALVCPACSATLAEPTARCPACGAAIEGAAPARFFLGAAGDPAARRAEILSLLGELRRIVTGDPAPAAADDRPPSLDDLAHHRGEPLGPHLLRQTARAVRQRGKVKAYLRSLDVLETACARDGGLSADQLEVMLLETLEAFSSRLDVWFVLGAVRRLVHKLVRPAPPAAGVYGWIERPAQGSGTPRPGRYLQAPSLDQGTAVAALGAVSASQDSDVRINLSSRRVRVALGLADAIRQGASIAEHLGQHAERLLRAEREDRWITVLRAAGKRPLAAATRADLLRIQGVGGALADELLRRRDSITAWTDLLAIEGLHFPTLGALRSHLELPSDPIEAARPPGARAAGVVDGEYLEALNLEELKRQLEDAAVESELVVRARACAPDAGDRDRSLALLARVRDRIAGVKDAFLDLVSAEVAYQQIRGNTARVDAWLAVADGVALPPEPEVVRTRRSGRRLIQTALVVFDEPPPLAAAAIGSVRARLEPGWESFCAGMHRAQLGDDVVRLRLSVRRAGERAAAWWLDTTAAAHGIGLVDLVVDGARCLERHKVRLLLETLAALRSAPDPRRWRELVAALGFRDDDAIGTIARGVEVELALREAELVLRRRDGTAGSWPLGPAVRIAAPGHATADLAALRALLGRAATRLVDELGFADAAALEAGAAALAVDVTLRGPAIVVTRPGDPDRTCAIRITTRQLRRLLARAGDARSMVAHLLASTGPESWRAIASAVGVAAGAPPGAIAAQTCLDLGPGAAAAEIRALHERLARLIRGGTPLISDRARIDDARWLLREVQARVRALHRVLVDAVVPAQAAELEAYLRDPAHAVVRGLLAGSIAPALFAELLRAPDAGRFAEAGARLGLQLERWREVCGRIVAESEVADTAPDTPELGTRVWRYVADVTQRLQALLEPIAEGRATAEVRPGELLFLPRISAAAGSVVAQLAGPDAQALADRPRRSILAQLAKARFARPALAALLCGRSPAELLAGYQVHRSEPPPGSEPFDRDTAMTHVFHPLGAAPGAAAVGFVVDRWTDFLPNSSETTALVVNYDAPQAEAPNALVLCAPALLWWSHGKVARALANVLDVARLRTLTATEIASSRLDADFSAPASCVLATTP